MQEHYKTVKYQGCYAMLGRNGYEMTVDYANWQRGSAAPFIVQTFSTKKAAGKYRIARNKEDRAIVRKINAENRACKLRCVPKIEVYEGQSRYLPQ